MSSATELLKAPYWRVLIPDAEAGGYTGLIKELPGCIAEGETVEEAFRNLELAAASWIEAAQELGQAIPEPSTDQDLIRSLLASHARLIEAERLLRAVQWGSSPQVALSECPWCLCYRREGHAADCRLAAFLSTTAAAEEPR